MAALRAYGSDEGDTKPSMKAASTNSTTATSAIAPFSWVRAVDSPDAANMLLSSRSVTIAIQAGKKNSEKFVVNVPVLVNSAPVEVDDELTVYRQPSSGSKTKRVAATHLGATVKTPKVA